MSQRIFFIIDSGACSGCKTCQMACKDKNDLEPGLLWRRVYEISGGEWVHREDTWESDVFAYNLSIACNHCEKPACLSACPNKAITKREDGIVLIDRERCMGCRYCQRACPYDSPRFRKETGTMSKCDLCFDDIDKDRLPACVSACPMRAIQVKRLERKNREGVRDVFPLPDPSITNPSLLIIPHRDAERAAQEKADVVNSEEL